MLTAVTVLVAILSVVAAGGLVALTTILHSTTVRSNSSLESVVLAEEIEIGLLMHERAVDALVRHELEDDVAGKLVEANRFVTTDNERHVLLRTESQVRAYLSASHDAGPEAADSTNLKESAFDALRELVNINVEQSKAARQRAATLDDVGDSLGVGIGTLVVLLSVALLLWLKGRAFETLFELASAMEGFGQGNLAIRAAERGPLELFDMARRFNEMASAITAQRQAQMAFVGGVAHDLRNPLNAIKVSLELLGRQDGPLPPDRVRKALDAGARQVQRMERMVEDFLDVARIEAGELHLEIGVWDLRELVRGTMELFGAGAARNRGLKVSMPDEPLVVRCDRLRIEQVITNLVGNAIKYSPPGTDIEVAADSRDGEVVLSVADHGVGISEEDRQRVFEPFQRVGPSSGAVPGVGLGLFVVRKIVEAHGGRVDVDSTPGRGSTFRVSMRRSPKVDPARL